MICRKSLLAFIGALAVATSASAWRPPPPTTHVVMGAFNPYSPSASGSGTITLTFDSVARTMRVDQAWVGLSSPATGSQLLLFASEMNPFDPANAPVFAGDGLPEFAPGAIDGVHSTVVNLEDRTLFTDAFLAYAATESGGDTYVALFASFQLREAYAVLQSQAMPDAHLYAIPVAEPATAAMLCLGIFGVAAARAVARRG